MTKELLYLEQVSLLEFDATVENITEENGKHAVVLDKTAFYPQGGGQPYDQGVIESPNGKFLVEEVRWENGTVRHIGTFEKGDFKKGEAVHGVINKERRELHSRIHSAGHVVDRAVSELALPWTPGKGYHFPQGPYVEYVGSLPETGRDELKKRLEEECNKFVSAGCPRNIRFVEKSGLGQFCRFVPDNIPEGKPTRLVCFWDFCVPCGGTHVADVSDIKSMSIRKLKQEGGTVRVGYDVSK
jgi:Ser-tRNA(Ala) deacylase AlaX